MKHEIGAGQFLFIGAILYVIIQIDNDKYGLLNLNTCKCVFNFKFSGVLTVTYLRSLKTNTGFPEGYIRIIDKFKIVHLEPSFSKTLPISIFVKTIIAVWTIYSSTKKYLLMVNVQEIPSLIDISSWKTIIQFDNYSHLGAVSYSEIHEKLRELDYYDIYLVKERCAFRKKEK